MNRHEFIALLAGTAIAWPLGARAQQSERVRRIGVLLNLSEGSGARDGGFVIAGGPEMALAITAKHVLTRYRQSRTAEGTREDHGSCILSMPS
jgi:putative ABC transport system substrate-binding protein